MKKQKICIVGGGLTGLATANTLSRLNVEIDLVAGSINNANLASNRTTAISQDNFNFIKKLNICKFSKKEFWPCSYMKLYSKNEKKFTEIFQIYKERKKVLYMINNSFLIKKMMRKIKKNECIKIKTQKKISGITTDGLLKSIEFKNKDNSKYNLIILCTGNNSNLTNIFFNDESINFPYQELSITTILKHSFLKNNIVRQIFLDNSILALLPISNTKTSIVWSVKKKIITENKSKVNLFIKNKIKFYTKDFLKNIKFISDIEFKDLKLFIKKEYFQDRVLFFGDAIHQVHPLAGQGFNMMLRDLSSLEDTLKNKINLGLDIGSSDILSEFSNTIKPRNFIYSLGIDFLKNCFSFKNKPFKNFRNKIIIKLNKNNFAKDFFFNIADEGFKF